MVELRKMRTGWTALLASLLTVAFLLTGTHVRAGESPGEKLDLIRRMVGERGEYSLAETQLKSFVEEYQGRPVAAEALVLLGYCQDKQKKTDAAAGTYARVISEYPTAPASLRADASLRAADAFFKLDDFREAARLYTMVLDLDERPEQTEAALLWRGEANYRLATNESGAGRPPGDLLKDAAADFTAFMDRHGDSKLLPAAVSGAAFSLFDSGDYPRALDLFQRFITEFPDDRRVDECMYYRAESLLRLKRYPEAREAFARVVAKSADGPFAADARAGEAWAEYDLGRVAEAAAGFEKAAEIATLGDRPGVEEEERAAMRDQALSFLYDAGCAYREAGNAAKAGECLTKVAEAKDHELSSLAWYRLGTLWQEQARHFRERAERESDPARKNAALKDQRDRGAAAIRYFQRALAAGRLGDEEIEATSLLGEVLLDAERYDDAAKAFAEIAERWPNSDRAAWALYHQALAEKELSQNADSETGKKERLAAAAAALRKSLAFAQAKTRLQAAWALADYLTTLGDTEGAREQYRWLAADGVAWARAWIDREGRSDPALEMRAREYASDSLFRLGESYYFANDYPRASGFYQEIVNNQADTPQVAMALLRLGEIAEAGRDNAVAKVRYEDALRHGMRLGKGQVGATISYSQLRLGTLLLRLGQKEPVEEMRRKILQEASAYLTAVIADPPEGLNLARPHYYLAEAKYNLGLKKEALAEYQASLKADARGELSDVAWFGLAWARRDLEDEKGALEAAGKVIADFPDSTVRPDAYALVAAIRRSGGDAAGALKDLDEFIAQYPDHQLAAKAELERASALDETGEHAAAADAFQAFLRKHPEHPDVPQALYQRSWALWNRIRPQAQQVRDAEARLRDLSGGRPVGELPEADRAEAAKAEAELASLSGEVRKAEDEILSALQGLTARYPDYPVVDAAWLRIGEILYDRGEFQQALNAYQRALSAAKERSSDMADKAQYRMAWSTQRLAEAAERASLSNPDQSRREASRKEMWDRRVAAIDAFESILGLYPKSDLVGDACFRAAELRRRSGQDNADPARRAAWFESAAEGYRQALAKGGTNAPYRAAAEYGEGLCLLLNGQSSDALKVFQRLLRNPDGPYVQDAYWGLGQANLNLGAYADATSAFEQALTLDKTTETAAKSRFGLGVTAALAGDNTTAMAEFVMVEILYPNYPEWAAAALVRAARAAQSEGLKEKAIGYLEQVLAKYHDTPAAAEARDLQSSLSAVE